MATMVTMLGIRTFQKSKSTLMHLKFLPRDARSASAVLLSYVVRPSVPLSICLSVTLMYAEHIGWTSSKLITHTIVAVK